MELLYDIWRKSIRKIWKISPRSHCNLLHHINSCDPIDNIMEKRCMKSICYIMNSDSRLFDRTVKHSLSMSRNTLGENIIYLSTNMVLICANGTDIRVSFMGRFKSTD